ncbi:hypothetical protein [Streptacidiphilus griseoplanus]|uniref:hypothetical protein n=1 Tax=Peterkaempfera griseoplana TaxID=66896 RepID=UPI000B1EAD0B|nr:hypothetical protein [Peterkaempfera griseoplana]
MLEQVDDALRDKRSVFKVAEPVIQLHQLLIQRHEPELVVGRADRVWTENADTVAGKIYGPHFEELARQWCFEHASDETLGGRASWVRPTEIPCREHRRGHELDLVVGESPAFCSERITAIGEAKGTVKPVDVAELERLEHLRGLLPGHRVGTSPKLLLFARSGFTVELGRVASGRGDVELVDLERLYQGA